MARAPRTSSELVALGPGLSPRLGADGSRRRGAVGLVEKPSRRDYAMRATPVPDPGRDESGPYLEAVLAIARDR